MLRRETVIWAMGNAQRPNAGFRAEASENFSIF
jgi:hypothetical protein